MTDNESKWVLASLTRIEGKLDEHLTEHTPMEARVAVAECKLSTHSKIFWAGAGIIVSLLVETGVGFVFLAVQHFGG